MAASSARASIPISLDRDVYEGAVDLAQIIRRQFNRSRAEVFIQSFDLSAPRNWNDPRLLRQQPRERDLGRCRSFGLRDVRQKVNDNLIGSERLRCETRVAAANIGRVEGCGFVDFPRQKAASQRAV